MKRAQIWALALTLTWGAAARASDPAGIYALVDKVELEPNEQSPERIKLWGGFCLAANRGDQYSAPAQGYMYFSLVPGHERECRAEWADFKHIAGTDQCVAFGNRYGVKGGVRHAKLHVNPEGPADPQRIAKLVTDLDSKQFQVRENASQELEKMGEAALPALRKALAGRPSEEARKRLDRLVNKDEPDVYPLGVGVIKVNTGTNYDTDYPPIRALLQLPATKAPGMFPRPPRTQIMNVSGPKAAPKNGWTEYWMMRSAPASPAMAPPTAEVTRYTRWAWAPISAMASRSCETARMAVPMKVRVRNR